MNHCILFLVLALCTEVIIRSNYVAKINSTIKVCKKATYIILNKNISDHWKENIIPAYSLKIMISSLQMLLIISLIIFIFLTIDNIFNGFLVFTFSIKGIIECIFFAFIYFYIRKLIVR